MGAMLDGVEEPSLGESKLKSAKLPRKELDDLQRRRWCDNHVVDTMNNAVRGELFRASEAEIEARMGCPYNIGRNDLAEEVDVQALEEAKPNTKTLGFATEAFFTVSRGNGMGYKDTASRIKIRRNMICQYVLDQLL
jgi:hypothetical protein